MVWSWYAKTRAVPAVPAEYLTGYKDGEGKEGRYLACWAGHESVFTFIPGYDKPRITEDNGVTSDDVDNIAMFVSIDGGPGVETSL